MMNYQEAWSIVEKTVKNVEVEAAYEVDDFFVFGLKRKGAPSGIGTGASNVVINKTTKEVSVAAVGDPRLTTNKIFKIHDQGEV